MSGPDSSTKTAKASSLATASTNTNVSMTSLEETLRKVESSLLPSIQSYIKSTTKSGPSGPSRPSPQTGGLDFLHAKNTLLLSYLIDLIVLIRDNHAHDG